MKHWLLCSFIIILAFGGLQPLSAKGPAKNSHKEAKNAVLPGAYNLEAYLPLLKGRKCALLINQTAEVGKRSLLDTLLSRNINIIKVFVPEHGFRGLADAGDHIKNGVDSTTGTPMISLYGDNKKPRPEQLSDVDVVIYDLQDVGVRFYTYISSLEYMMEACAAAGRELLILDRPNPNGHYVDGPVLNKSLRSFVGMQEIPVVYGMTVGEYAQMLVGEKKIELAAELKYKVIPCIHYDHSLRYEIPVPPSPNLKNMAAIYLYPSLCLFEGTVISVGRGTDKPFQQWGHPDLKGKSDYYFIPKATTGASKPLYEGKPCYGKLLSTKSDQSYALVNGRLDLEWLIEAYQWYPDKAHFFNSFFEKLAGTEELRGQITQGLTAEEIRKSWQPAIKEFKKIRKKYLLYKDFE